MFPKNKNPSDKTGEATFSLSRQFQLVLYPTCFLFQFRAWKTFKIEYLYLRKNADRINPDKWQPWAPIILNSLVRLGAASDKIRSLGTTLGSVAFMGVRRPPWEIPRCWPGTFFGNSRQIRAFRYSPKVVLFNQSVCVYWTVRTETVRFQC